MYTALLKHYISINVCNFMAKVDTYHRSLLHQAFVDDSVDCQYSKFLIQIIDTLVGV